jgi:type I restriction enzyme M protein
LGKTNPLNDNDLSEFVSLQKDRTDSENSWTIDLSDIDRDSFDLSPKNPNIPEEVPLRPPEEIIEDMMTRDKETADILEKIRGML